MLTLAKRLTIRAGEMALAGAQHATASLKDDASVVTETDGAVQRMILQAVADAYPDHAVIAEEAMDAPEHHADRASARYCWVVDPIDGTRNYVAGLPCFSTSIAVLDQGRPVVGAIREHNTNQLYTATVGGGAYLDDRPVRINEGANIYDYLIGVPSNKNALTISILTSWLKTKGLLSRNLGSAAAHLAYVSSGGLDAALTTRAKIWDVAAGTLLVLEAGGRVTDLSGTDLVPFDLRADPAAALPALAAGPTMHERLVETTSEAVRRLQSA